MLASTAVRPRIAIVGRRTGQLGTLVLMVGLGVAMVLPQDVVWCRGPGHSALEPAWAACCGPCGGEDRCAAWSAIPEAAGTPALASSRTGGCLDLQLGVPGAIVPPSPLHATHAAIAAPAVACSGDPEPARPFPASSSARVSSQVQAIIGATVLTT